MIELIEENPPPPKPRMSKYRDVFALACKSPWTWYRIDKEYKALSSVTYLRNKYTYFPVTIGKELTLKFAGTTVNERVHIYVMAVDNDIEE